MDVKFEKPFKKAFKELTRENQIKVYKQIYKIKTNPFLGKPMRFDRKGTRELYISPYRLSYAY